MAASNSMNLDRLLEIAKEQGSHAGRGRDAQVKFSAAACEGAYFNAVDLMPNKHGTDIDDATKLAQTYVLSRAGVNKFDPKAPNQRKLISCLRAMIKLGHWPKGGQGEPLATMNNLLNTWSLLRAKPETAATLDDANNTLLKYARTQIKRDTLIADTELKSFCFKPNPTQKTPEQIIESMRDQLTNLINGALANNTAQDNSAKVTAARNALTDRLKEIATIRGKVNGNNPKP